MLFWTGFVAADTTLTVGVFQNPPIIAQSATGAPEGLSVDVLEYIARREGWQLEYRWAPWRQQLDALGRGELDLLVGIAHTAARAERYAFTNEALINNWGVIYRRFDERIESVIDLQGRRVAVMRGATHTSAFRALAERFQIAVTEVETASYAEALRAVQQGEADAAVVNRLVGRLKEPELDAIAPTAVLFNPIEVRFAAPLDAEPRVLAAIDRRLAELKADSGSIYYRSLDRWLGGGTTGISQRVALLTLLGAGVLVLGFVLLSVLLRVQVRQRTAELQAQSGDLRREIDERRKAEERLNELAYFDTLTGLPNRALLLDRLGQALEHARRNQTLVAVLFFDIDDFKKVNDSLGHAFGDQLLQEFSERIGERIREADTLSRLGGDEFTLVLTDIERADDAAAVAIDLLETLTPPFLIEGHEIMAPVSIGITMFPNDGDNVDELLKHADTAMYQAKGQGKRQYRFYSPELTARVHERLSLEGALRQALRLGRLELHYQPQISLAQPGLVAVEALLRWRGEDGRMIPPAEFIPVAEDSGLIGPVGAWVMERACQDLKHWEEAGVEVPRVAINLSSRQLETGRLSSLIAKVLSRTGVAGERLELEITESVFVEQTRENIAILTSLQDLGCRIAVDDFGTGYASFNYLQRLPLQCVKIDRSFIAEIDDSGRTRRLVAAMAAMAEALDISIVAEGVETQSQLAYVRAHGYGAAQGYLIARAMSAEALEQWLREPSHLAAS